MFPGSETAGLVRRLKSNPARRVTPLYYFRLDLPQQKEPPEPGFRAIARPGDESRRAVGRVDPLGRYLYVLYYPKQEKPSEQFSLHVE